MATTLLTGATGTVGSSLASLLKKKGHQLVYLVRPKDGQNAKDRLVDNSFVLEGDITRPHLGINVQERRKWKKKIDKILNCAASIKLDGGFSETTSQVNIEGVRNLLQFAEELKIPEFHQVSTVYVSGSADYFSEEDFDIGQTSRNHYEQTKREAEQLVRAWKYGRYSIYRLGIVVGAYNNGYIPTFNGYYVFASSLWHLRNTLLGKNEQEMKRYEREGVSLDLDRMLTLPIYLNFAPNSTLNIIPVDWASDIVSELVAVPAKRKVFHIVHPSPRRARWVNDVSLKHLGIKGFYYGDFADFSSRSLLGRLQKIYNRSTLQYIPYITHESRFEVANAPYVLGERYRLPPEIDEIFIVTILDYAKSVDFGRRKQKIKAVEA
ncbi:MAG: SDR family oxidoreductase [Candidatus Pacebacteria bacterium]|nr:SDR family oxidoreductase [Candidatus Paceibacterota bacterium]